MSHLAREKERGEGCSLAEKTVAQEVVLIEVGRVVTVEEGRGRSAVEMEAEG